jgi:hypothetical protein
VNDRIVVIELLPATGDEDPLYGLLAKRHRFHIPDGEVTATLTPKLHPEVYFRQMQKVAAEIAELLKRMRRDAEPNADSKGVGPGARQGPVKTPVKTRKVFISYRRQDSANAGRVYDLLEREFGRDLLFMDVDAIELGVDFLKAISAEVAKCDVLLAIIGPGWLDASDEEGNRRLNNKNDFVRIEIAAALKRDIPVIPLLFDGTPIPTEDRLPKDLKALVLRNGISVRHASFHRDTDKLISFLRGRGPC